MNSIKIIQERQLHMLKEFINICDNNNLKYFIIGGTLLGAVRHKGFIPWDDDIDIGMPRDDYEYFKIISKDTVSDDFFCDIDLYNDNYKLPYIKFCDKKTKVYFKLGDQKKVFNLWMDIFPIDGMPGSFFKKNIHKFKYLYNRMMYNLSNFSNIVNLNRNNRPLIEKIIVKLFSKINLEKFLDKDLRKRNYIKVIKKYNISEKYAGNYTGNYKLKEIVPSYYFGNGKKLLFENLEVNVPDEYEKYLSNIYGNNYMDIPKEVSRDNHNFEIV